MLIRRIRGQQRGLSVGAVSMIHTTKTFQNIELFKTQFAYGHREILLDYMGLDHSHLFLGILQHGFAATFEPWEANTPRTKKVFQRCPLWVFSEERAQGLKSLGHSNVSAIGAPWLYLPESKSDCLRQSLTERFIVFPNHTDLRILPPSEAEIRAKVKFWKNLAGNNPLTICLYWSDFLEQSWRKVSEQEDVLITLAGLGGLDPAWLPHSSRLNYLHNLRQLLSIHTHAIFETFTSAIFYAAFEGLDIACFPEVLTNREKLSTTFLDGDPWIKKEMPSIYSNFDSSSNLAPCWNKMMGVDSKMTPEGLRRHLEIEPNCVPVLN